MSGYSWVSVYICVHTEYTYSMPIYGLIWRRACIYVYICTFTPPSPNTFFVCLSPARSLPSFLFFSPPLFPPLRALAGPQQKASSHKKWINVIILPGCRLKRTASCVRVLTWYRVSETWERALSPPFANSHRARGDVIKTFVRSVEIPLSHVSQFYVFLNAK